MTNNNSSINICFASDNGYAEHLLVAIYSLVYNLDKNYIANIYILDSGIQESNKTRIKNLEDTFPNITINFEVADIEYYKKFQTPSHVTKETFLRLELPNRLQELDEVLYLDCDIIINSDISFLGSYSLHGYLGGVVKDIGAYFHYKEIMGLPDISGYFNAGVVLMNLKQMRLENFTEKSLKFLNENGEKLALADQDLLNIFLNSRKVNLSLKYNALDRVFIGPKNKQFPESEISEARKNPVVIHYAGSKPWKKYCTHPLKGQYYTYRQMAGLDPIKFDNKLELKLLIKNVVWLLGVYLLNIIPRRYYYYIVFKPKQFLSKLF